MNEVLNGLPPESFSSQLFMSYSFLARYYIFGN
jgi:hypothetical protein